MLQMNPIRRINCTDALKHSYLNKWSVLNDAEDDLDESNESIDNQRNTDINDINNNEDNDLTISEWKGIFSRSFHFFKFSL